MELSDFVASLDLEGARLRAAADKCDLDTPVRTCPGWDVRTLVRHIGGVHRWATEHVTTPRHGDSDPDLERLVGGWPTDGALLDWFTEGHTRLVSTIATADPELDYWTFLPAPTPLLFWARRQAHETCIHRVDAEVASGGVTPCEPEFAVDGVGELLLGFAARKRRLGVTVTRTLGLDPIDHDTTWSVSLGPDGIRSGRDVPPEGADCLVSATASDIYMLLWNRLSPDATEVRGDRGVLQLWQETVRVRWA